MNEIDSLNKNLKSEEDLRMKIEKKLQEKSNDMAQLIQEVAKTPGSPAISSSDRSDSNKLDLHDSNIKDLKQK